MRKLLLSACMVACFGWPIIGHSATAGGCQAKEEAILKELEYARSHGNAHRVQGLERALSNVRLWCSDEKLLREAKEKLAKQEKKVQERRGDLEEARAKGDAKKIGKREKKLREAEEKYKELQDALQGLE